MTVHLARRGNVAIVTIDNPPVNALGHAVRRELSDTLARIEADVDVAAVVLICAGRTFSAGADVREFDKPPAAPALGAVLRAIDHATKPWIAAIQGTALGGGLELALACRFRIACPNARLGLPEVTLGLIPGAGGTVLLPRLIPADKALEIIGFGKPVNAREAQAVGLIDGIAEGDLLEAAMDFASGILVNPLPPPAIARQVIPESAPGAFVAVATRIAAKTPGQHAPAAAVQALRGSLSIPPIEALAAEAQTFRHLKQSDQSRALRHVFLAERNTTRSVRLDGAAPNDLAMMGVIGGGTMGAGIAAACLLAGLSVVMIERDTAAAAAGAARVSEIIASSEKRGLISAKKHALIKRAFLTSDDYAALARADLVIEAVFEDMGVKKQVFAQLDAVTRPDAILASNTSYLDLNEIAASTRNPARVIGLHFFSPAHVMRLLEIVMPDAAADRTLAKALSLAERLRKVPVLAGVCDGFIANRIMSAYRCECEYMLEEGALPWQVDRAMTAFGMPMGIFQMQDLAGLDISWAMRKRQAATRDQDARYVEIGDRLCEAGRLGRKSGRGYYWYPDGKTPVPDPEVEALIKQESERKRLRRIVPSDAAIMERILSTMQAEGHRILREGIARNADDIDVVMVNAFGFPRWRGGPMFMETRVRTTDTVQPGTDGPPDQDQCRT
ncbi:3-hydroxyacyl-CoA dehydrogenase NAD-binding domain-containing protein [Solirhodobacter olei]|uniref:3-hydroxyacyl-CoA dehydrogenase NAD-binding domain-containing protein n=1 Tax=Solirhodobacter olei TaxID=2493082 RepID=UPI000FD70D07|nr:3-hydroxyacyl-CoA dehydrogenase NAD-binding domain-containing protein [Solirhodobacter olei]